VETPFTEIVVPLDGSPAGERGLAPALELVRRTGVPLWVLRRAFSDETAAVADYLAEVAGRNADVADIGTVVVVRESIPDAILDGLAPGSLVCMSSHGRGGLSRAVLGSIAEALLRMLDRPALVVGPGVDDATLAGRVTACLDGSPASAQVLGPARAWATMLDRPLWLLQVEDPAAAGAGGELAGDCNLDAQARTVGAAGWDVLHGDDVARSLADAAGSPSAPAGMLVLATHGRTGWDRLRLGSVTTATIQHSPVPVLVVPAGAPAP
jgi:nucleotide-binding universal stress UspA family protein